jgi:DNA-binding NtrC family response regulator
MAAAQLLLVEDDNAMREMLESLFRQEGYVVSEAASANAALDLARETDFDVVLSDIKMPGKSGLELVGELRELRPDMPVVLMTAFGSIDTAVDAMRAGAFGYTTKPFQPEEVIRTVKRALDRRAVEDSNRKLRGNATSASFKELIGDSASMRHVFSIIRRAAHVDASVLITGESGTGKEMVARTLHHHGRRAQKPFLPINCTAIPEGLLESELFGHVRGAFTGAVATKRGLFERADGRHAVPRRDRRHGRRSPGQAPARAPGPRGAPGRQHAGGEGGRADHCGDQPQSRRGDGGRPLPRRPLLPPERDPDPPAPAARAGPRTCPRSSRRSCASTAGDRARRFSRDAIARLQSQEWRGNARELENVIERTLALSDADLLNVSDLPLDPPPTSRSWICAIRAAAAGWSRRWPTPRATASRCARSRTCTSSRCSCDGRQEGRGGADARHRPEDAYRRDPTH